jgi:UDP-glucose 4-epimerase
MGAPLRVAMTGASGTLARPVIRLLDTDDRVEEIRALDIRPYEGPSSAKIRAFKTDVRNLEALRSAFCGADAVIHLAFVVASRIPRRADVYAVNVGGTSNVARAAAESGAKTLVYISSQAAYGMVPENPPVLTEDMPLRGEQTPEHDYAFTKAIVERDLEMFAAAHPRPTITRFRAHLVCGPDVLHHSEAPVLVPDLSSAAGAYRAFRPRGPNGAWIQYTHEEDLAAAIRFALHRPLPGAYNIAGEPMNLDLRLGELGKTFRPVPWGPVFALATALAPFSRRIRAARSWLTGARYRNLLDCSKLRSAGFNGPLRATRECFDEAQAIFAERRALGSAGTRKDDR